MLDLDKLELEVGNVKEKLDNNDGGTHNYVGARSGGVSIMCDKGNYEGSRIDVEDDGIYIESETDSINLSSPNYVEIISGTFPNNSRIMAKGTNVSIAADSATLNGKAIATSEDIDGLAGDIAATDIQVERLKTQKQNKVPGLDNDGNEIIFAGNVYSGATVESHPEEKRLVTKGELDELGSEVGKVAKSAEELKKESVKLKEDLAELEAVALVDCEMKYGQPRVLYGAGTPQEAIVPDNWVGMDEGGCYWNGQPLFVGQVYININATSNGRYTGVRNANYGNIVWKNF